MQDSSMDHSKDSTVGSKEDKAANYVVSATQEIKICYKCTLKRNTVP
uniref:Uncharacterized protein n=1 Tax=Arundo donax TaxID=35708 RepID=A0A0A8ZYK2_ARUDO